MSPAAAKSVRRLLIIVQSDPRTSGRPAEAVRLAAGVSAWEKVRVSLYLAGESTRLLVSDGSPIVDGDGLEEHLEMLRDRDHRLYVERGNPHLGRDADAFALPTTTGQLADLVADHDYTVRF